MWPLAAHRQALRHGRVGGLRYRASHSRWFWGLRLYLICTPAGIPILWALAGPKTGEREVLAAMLDVEPQPPATRPRLTLITG
jgi:hypothetical protein